MMSADVSQVSVTLFPSFKHFFHCLVIREGRVASDEAGLGAFVVAGDVVSQDDRRKGNRRFDG